MTAGIHFVSLGEEEFVAEAVAIVEKAQASGVILRILGSLAAHIMATNSEAANALPALSRFGEGMPRFTDLDLAAYGKQGAGVEKVFRELGFKPDTMVNGLFGSRRLIYYHPQNKYNVDVFLNRLEFSHDVEFGDKPGRGRLELEYPTISPADLILEKLQIHSINHKDIVDLALVFMAVEVKARDAGKAIDADYIAQVLANDWGFWYDATSNLARVQGQLAELAESEKLSPDLIRTAQRRVEQLLEIIAKYPKSNGWQKRAKKGTGKIWYHEVEEIQR